MALRPSATARWVFATPGGADTYCAVSAFRRHPLSLAPPRRPAPDRQEHPAAAQRAARLAVSAARWHVDVPARMDDLARALRAPGARRRPLRLRGGAGHPRRIASCIAAGSDAPRNGGRGHIGRQGGSARSGEDHQQDLQGGGVGHHSPILPCPTTDRRGGHLGRIFGRYSPEPIARTVERLRDATATACALRRTYRQPSTTGNKSRPARPAIA
jgi:hypothetical protein